jgi:hypothetical protein
MNLSVFALTQLIPPPTASASPPKAFEIKDFSFGIENPTTIG